MNRRGLLCIDGYAGRVEQPVEIVGECLRLGGAYRWAEPNTIVLVPKRAVKEV